MKRPRSAVSFAVCLAASLASVAQADRLDAIVRLGGSATTTVTGAGDVASVGFLVTEGTGRKLALGVKRAKGSTLAPEVKLIQPDGTALAIAVAGGSEKPGPTSWSAKLPNVPKTGLWRIEVRGAGGSAGGAVVSVKGKDSFKIAGSATLPVNGKQDVAIEAGDGAAITVSASRAGSNVVTQVVILDANGAAVAAAPFVASPSSGKLSLKAYRLPTFGKYTLRFSGANGSGGGMKYAVSGALAKVKGTLPTAVVPPPAETEPSIATTLDGSGSRPSASRPLAYRWVQVSGPAVVLTGPATAKPTFTAPATETTLAFQLSVDEAGALSVPVTHEVTVARRPVADAGRSQTVASAAAVTLDGSKSFDRRGKGLAYAWRQIPGDTQSVTLAGAATAAPTFTAPAGNHTLHFGLVVDDGNARSFEDVVVVEVGTANVSVADAGREQYVSRMASVHLSGLASKTASGVLDSGLQWTQTAGPAVVLAGATTPFPSFTSPRTAADLEFELRVAGTAATADRVAVHVRPGETNLPAAADANGPLNAPSGPVQLAATLTTDPNGNPLSFRWAQISGTPVPIADADTVSATATIAAGSEIYEFCVSCNDGLQYGSPDIVTLRNTSYSLLPLANAGDNRKSSPGVPVQLDGTGSSHTDGTSTPLAYAWTQVSGRDWFDVTTSLVPFNPAVARPSFAVPTDVSSLTPTRTIVMQLVVSDANGASRPDFVSITFENLPLNGKPSVAAQASEGNPVAGTLITLTGTATDRDGDPVTVKWTQTSGTPVALSPNATSLSATFVAPDASGVIAFSFVGNDGFDDSAAATASVNVDAKPVANIAVSPQSGAPGTQVTMDGGASADPEGRPLTYQWTQISGTTVNIVDPNAVLIRFDAPTGAVGFRLVVNDGRQSSDARTAAFSASPPPTTNPTADRANAAYGATVTLSANPGAGGPFTYAWRQINPSGTDPVVTLSSATAQNPTFTVPTPTAAPFGLTPRATFGVIASDSLQSSVEKTVQVTFFASLADNSQTTNTVMAIISSRCASCHSGSNNSCPVGSGSNATGYGLQTKAAFLANTVNQNDCSGSPKQRLPGTGQTGQSGTNAYFFDRLKSGGATPRMPTSGSYLTPAELNLIQDWIDQGVQDN